jgi:hypothetical protein
MSHLLFANDPILFFRSQQYQAERMLNIINTYATATGKLINYDKCSISFSEHCPSDIKNQVKSVLHVQADGT